MRIPGLFLQFVLSLAFLMGCAKHNSSLEKRKQSKHFSEGRFHNSKKWQKKSLVDVMTMRLNTPWAQWPKWIDITQNRQIVKRVDGKEIKATFINHATVLIQSHGINILTDPIFSDRCSPVTFAGPKRVHAPGIAFEDLPPIDIILISHDHYDHLDRPTLDKLIARDNPKIFAGLGVGSRLSSLDNVFELDWWQTQELATQIKVSFVEVQHFSGRGLRDWFSTLWGGFVIELGKKKIYFGGDSGYSTHYKKTFDRFGSMDLAILPIGAYAPRSFMKNAHMNPEEAVMAHLDLKSKKSIGIHFGTFQLTAEPINEPQEKLAVAIQNKGLNTQSFVTLAPGESLTTE